MPDDPVIIPLRPEYFTAAPAVVARHAGMTATAFRYAGSVAGLTLSNEAGQIDLLPFHGQQIWDASFYGRRLTMGSMFDEPVAGFNQRWKLNSTSSAVKSSPLLHLTPWRRRNVQVLRSSEGSQLSAR